MNKRYKPKTDKFFVWMLVIVNAVFIPLLVLAFFEPISLFFTVPLLLFCNYFMFSPLFGYAETREDCLFIKYGLLLKKTIPYEKIRKIERGRGIISEAMLNLKLSFDHLAIKYNTFDFTIVSIKEEEAFLTALAEKIGSAN